MSQRLAQCLADHKQALLAEWVARVRADTQVPQADTLPTLALIDHMPLLIDQIARRLVENGDPERAGRAVGVSQMAFEHAQERFDENYDLKAALRELAIFRVVLLDRFTVESVELDHDSAVVIHAAIDAAMATSALELERLRASSLRASADALRAEAELRERFVAILSHDLRTPLQTIGLGAQSLERDDLDARTKRTLARIADSSARMNRLIEEMLDFTRLRRGGMPIHPVPGELAGIVQTALGEIATANPSRHVHVHVEGDTAGTWDADRITQILTNLVGNAIQHGAVDAPVHITVTGHPCAVTLAVHNAGAPIPADVMAYIFEPFRRASKRVIGLGLGLYIVREIARAHGGDVTVTSNDDDGTTFLVTFPRAARTP